MMIISHEQIKNLLKALLALDGIASPRLFSPCLGKEQKTIKGKTFKRKTSTLILIEKKKLFIPSQRVLSTSKHIEEPAVR